MGCDIHMYCEEKSTIDGVKEWRNVDHLRRNHYHHMDTENEPEFEVVQLCGERNYSMFSALCGVRDYTGETPKISEPRGLPDDCSDFVKQESERWGCDGHSHGYVTLKEVKEFCDKNEPVKYSGLVRKEDAKAYKETGKLPSSWCQGASNRDAYEFLEWEDSTVTPLSNLLSLMSKRFRPCWNLEDISSEEMENFRIVFWFDN